jgi:A/G-specific adenine glycosylase
MNQPFTRKLMVWNRRWNHRSMPWKGETDPYKIWLSEIILQQTRVEQGLKYYHSFIIEFPTVLHLASAPDEKVYKMWEGLGYYSRCKNLLHTAREIQRTYHGVFPDRYNEIRRLKGIGPYTAAAIASFAFNQPYAVVDGNVQRVISRYFGVSTPTDTSQGKAFYQALADELLDTKKPGLYNQAIMDFGAVICKPQNPLCNECIHRTECVAFKNGYVNKLPVKEKTLIKKNRWLYYFLIEVNNSFYIRKRIENDIWQNLHEFVLFDSPKPVKEPFLKQSFLEKLFERGLYKITHISMLYKQQLTHQNIFSQFILVKAEQELPALHLFTLVNKDKLARFAFPKIINQYLHEDAQSPVN